MKPLLRRLVGVFGTSLAVIIGIEVVSVFVFGQYDGKFGGPWGHFRFVTQMAVLYAVVNVVGSALPSPFALRLIVEQSTRSSYLSGIIVGATASALLLAGVTATIATAIARLLTRSRIDPLVFAILLVATVVTTGELLLRARRHRHTSWPAP